MPEELKQILDRVQSENTEPEYLLAWLICKMGLTAQAAYDITLDKFEVNEAGRLAVRPARVWVLVPKSVAAIFERNIEQLFPGWRDATLEARSHMSLYLLPLFVPLAEEGMLDHPATRMIAEEYLRELRASTIESLILGCTHYPLLAPMIHELMGPGVTLIDSGAEAARSVAALLEQHGQLAAHARPEHRFFLSDEPRNFRRIAQTFLGHGIEQLELVELGTAG